MVEYRDPTAPTYTEQVVAETTARVDRTFRDKIVSLESKNAQLEQWVADCQSGMYINCVYCGHRYGPREDTPVAMADVLREHIEQCPQHPLSHAKAEIADLRTLLTEAIKK